MELALGALGGLAPKLTELLQDEYVKQKGLKPDIEALSRELVMMHAALVDVSRVPREQLPEVDKVWGRRVRELAYDTEDAIDTFVLLAREREPAAADLNVFKKMGRKAIDIAKNYKGRHQLADRVKDIKNLSKELADLCTRYRFSGTAANTTASQGMDPRLLNMYKTEAELVGIEGPRDELIRRLTDDGSNKKGLKIVSIVGFGGLGKTTLAKTVHDRLKKKFNCSAFVSVGRNPQITGVLEKLLEKLDEHKYSHIKTTRWDVEQLSDELHKFLQNRRSVI
jgi:Cdc6-like AAA superfamily ATPase